MRMRLSRDNKGFTLIEIMIVIAIIAVLMAIALPNMMRAREASQKRACLSNLREINQAKEQYAMECRKQEGDEVSWSDIVPGYLKTQPACPLGSAYGLQIIGTYPTCANPQHVMQ